MKLFSLNRIAENFIKMYQVALINTQLTNIHPVSQIVLVNLA